VIELVKKGELQELVEPGTRDREHSTMRGSQSARATGEVDGGFASHRYLMPGSVEAPKAHFAIVLYAPDVRAVSHP